VRLVTICERSRAVRARPQRTFPSLPLDRAHSVPFRKVISCEAISHATHPSSLDWNADPVVWWTAR
jgi:hypothetical protein